MTDATDLRRRAEQALRLARGISDGQAAQALKTHAAELFEQAESLERPDMPPPPPSAEQPSPALQQQQIPEDNEKKE
jgi:hypothetical protein